MAKKTKAPSEGETAAEQGKAKTGATAAKSAVKKSVPKKSASKKAAAKKTPVRPKGAAKAAGPAASPPTTPPARKKAAPRAISRDERQARIAEAAFLRAESLGFTGDPHDHWVQAEAEVDARLRKSRVKLID